MHHRNYFKESILLVLVYLPMKLSENYTCGKKLKKKRMKKNQRSIYSQLEYFYPRIPHAELRKECIHPLVDLSVLLPVEKKADLDLNFMRV